MLISLCSSRAYACEATLDYTRFLSADNCWESHLCHKLGSTSQESVEFNVSLLKGSSLYFVMPQAPSHLPVVSQVGARDCILCKHLLVNLRCLGTHNN